MTDVTETEVAQWEQALESLETSGLFDLTLAEYLSLLHAVSQVSKSHLCAGQRWTRTTLASSSPSSVMQAAASYWVERLMAERSALQSWRAMNDFATTLPLRTLLQSYTRGQQSIISSYSALCVLMLLDDLREDMLAREDEAYSIG